MKLSLVNAGEHVAHGSLAEWSSTLSPNERAQIRAIAHALARDEEAADELETWLALGHAAVHAWACAERQVAELKGIRPSDGSPARRSR